MSLEEAIKENTAAIRELIASLRGASENKAPARTLDADAESAQFYEKEEDKKRMAARKEPEPKKSTPASSPSVAEPVTEATAQESISVDLMKDVVPVFGKLCVAKGRDAGAEILKKWNVTKLSQVPASRLNDLLADIQQAAA